MGISKNYIDGGKAFDWGKTSEDYAKYRDIYPPLFYKKIADLGLCLNGQNVLDIGTGTGVLPRNMQRYGAHWTGVDIAENQILQAIRLSDGMGIKYICSPVEELQLPAHSFDAITACQCFWYFDHNMTEPLFRKLLKPGGHLLILYMAWLPNEDTIAGESERLILKYSPQWSGAGEYVHPIQIPKVYSSHFELKSHDEFRLKVHFTRESWKGRVKSCRGIGASLPPEEIRSWETEHQKLLQQIAPSEFDILHYAAMADLVLKQ